MSGAIEIEVRVPPAVAVDEDTDLELVLRNRGGEDRELVLFSDGEPTYRTRLEIRHLESGKSTVVGAVVPTVPTLASGHQITARLKPGSEHSQRARILSFSPSMVGQVELIAVLDLADGEQVRSAPVIVTVGQT